MFKNPVDVGSKLETTTDEDEYADQQQYQSAIGSLMYLTVSTRLDIAYAVGNLAKFSSKPSTKHWTALKRVLLYLKGTIKLGILYSQKSSGECVGYSDADWAGDINDRKSTSGYIFQISGAAVTWRSKKQGCLALSTAEAEYVALSSAAQESVWLSWLFNFLLLISFYSFQQCVIDYNVSLFSSFRALRLAYLLVSSIPFVSLYVLFSLSLGLLTACCIVCASNFNMASFHWCMSSWSLMLSKKSWSLWNNDRCQNLIRFRSSICFRWKEKKRDIINGDHSGTSKVTLVPEKKVGAYGIMTDVKILSASDPVYVSGGKKKRDIIIGDHSGTSKVTL